MGPRSAGRATRGPACYGRGGTKPTVTDANLLLGYLDAHSTLAGGVGLDPDAAPARDRRARSASWAWTSWTTAEGIVRVAEPGDGAGAAGRHRGARESIRAGFALMPFGGAGPMHAAALAEELGIERILCPRASGVLSALGLIASERRRDTARTVLLSGDDLTGERIAAEVSALRESISEGIDDASAEATYELRYRGQAFELAIRRLRSAGSRRAGRAVRRRARAPLRLPRPGRGSSWSTSASRSTVPGASLSPGLPIPGRLEPRPPAGPIRRRWLEARCFEASPPSGQASRGALRARAARGHPGAAARAGARRWTQHGTIVAVRNGVMIAITSTRHPAGAGRRACARPARRWARSWCARPIRPTSRSAAIARRRSSTPPASWSCRPSTSPCTWARCPTRSRRCSTPSSARATSGSSTIPTAAARTCPTSR